MLALSSFAIKIDTGAAPNLASPPGWRACVRADALLLSLHGDWSVRGEGSHAPTPDLFLEQPDVRAIVFDSSDLGRWDSSLLIFLSSLREAATRHRVDFDEAGLPAATRRLLALLPTEPQSPVDVIQHRRFDVQFWVEELGPCRLVEYQTDALVESAVLGEKAEIWQPFQVLHNALVGRVAASCRSE